MGQASKTKNKKKTNTKYFLIYEKNVYFFRQRNCFVDIWRCYVDVMLRFDLKESSPRNYNLTQNYSKSNVSIWAKGGFNCFPWKKNELEETLRAETKKKNKQPAEFIPRKQPTLLQ